MPCIYNLKPEDRYCNYCSAVCDERPIEKQAITTTNTMREVYAQGYRKAEKDLALTWQDIQAIVNIDQDLNNEEATVGPARKNKEHYEEVLKRYQEYKEEKK